MTESYLPIIIEAADRFSRTYGAFNNVAVMVRHWSMDSFPESGGSPQELLNEQFVRECDAAVAVFWTRFGSPTEKYKDQGLYCIVADEQELQKQFTNHLAQYFLTKIVDKAPAPVTLRVPALAVTAENGETEISLFRYTFSSSAFLTSKRDSIIAKVEKAKGINLPERIPEKKEPPANQNPLLPVTLDLSKMFAPQGPRDVADIDVKFYVRKGVFVHVGNIPVPGNQIIDEINDEGFLNILFCREATAKIDAFTDYPVSPYFEMPEFENPLERRDAGREYAKARSNYKDSLEHLFCYSVFADAEHDILEFNIHYLKQHRSVYFPTVLLIRENPEYIDYEIRSKNSSDVIEGRLTIKVDSGS